MEQVILNKNRSTTEMLGLQTRVDKSLVHVKDANIHFTQNGCVTVTRDIYYTWILVANLK